MKFSLVTTAIFLLSASSSVNARTSNDDFLLHLNPDEVGGEIHHRASQTTPKTTSSHTPRRFLRQKRDLSEPNHENFMYYTNPEDYEMATSGMGFDTCEDFSNANVLAGSASVCGGSLSADNLGCNLTSLEEGFIISSSNTTYNETNPSTNSKFILYNAPNTSASFGENFLVSRWNKESGSVEFSDPSTKAISFGISILEPETSVQAASRSGEIPTLSMRVHGTDDDENEKVLLGTISISTVLTSIDAINSSNFAFVGITSSDRITRVEFEGTGGPDDEGGFEILSNLCFGGFDDAGKDENINEDDSSRASPDTMPSLPSIKPVESDTSGTSNHSLDIFMAIVATATLGFLFV